MRNASALLIVFLLLLAPWAFGCVEWWAILAMEAVIALALLLALAQVNTARRHELPRPLWRWVWGAPLLALGGFIAIQAFNPSHAVQTAGSPLIPLRYVNWLPSSVNADSTWQTLGLCFAYAALFWLARTYFTATSRWKILCVILVLSGFAMAMFSIAQYMSGTSKMFWLRLWREIRHQPTETLPKN